MNVVSGKNKVLLYVQEDIPLLTALERVSEVIKEGRISKNGTCFCYITKFKLDGIVVSAETTLAGTDTFRVFKDVQ